MKSFAGWRTGPALPRYRLRLSVPLVADNLTRGAMSPQVFIYAEGVPTALLGREVLTTLEVELRYLDSETGSRTPYLFGSPMVLPSSPAP